MDKKSIIDAYCRIREINNTIPDEVLDFMKEASIEKVKEIEERELIRKMKEVVESKTSLFSWKKESSHYRSWKYGMRSLFDAYRLEIDNAIVKIKPLKS